MTRWNNTGHILCMNIRLFLMIWERTCERKPDADWQHIPRGNGIKLVNCPFLKSVFWSSQRFFVYCTTFYFHCQVSFWLQVFRNWKLVLKTFNTDLHWDLTMVIFWKCQHVEWKKRQEWTQGVGQADDLGNYQYHRYNKDFKGKQIVLQRKTLYMRILTVNIHIFTIFFCFMLTGKWRFDQNKKKNSMKSTVYVYIFELGNQITRIEDELFIRQCYFLNIMIGNVLQAQGSFIPESARQ